VRTLGFPPAAGGAAPIHTSSTHAYLEANYVFLHAVHISEHMVNLNVAKLNQTFAAECPSVGAGAPQNEAAQHMSYEVAGALWFTLYHTDAHIVQRFVRAVSPLRWGNNAITRISRGYVTSLRELAALRLPDLCGDVKAWSAGGFRTIPASTIQFDRHLEAIEGKSVPSHLLAPYESSTDKRLAARDASLEIQLEHAETVVGFDDWDNLLETLALNQ
jgi:hypothetical protein